jgi:hypothetical protein
MVNAANEREFHAAFAKVVQAGAGGHGRVPSRITADFVPALRT